jgi:putative hydrolase of HD superfamily
VVCGKVSSATTWSGNPGMIRLANKLGFVQEGCRRQGCNVMGKFYDIIELGILREEWERS